MGEVTIIIAVFPHLIILSCICNFNFQTSCDYLRLFVIAGSVTTLVAAFVKKTQWQFFVNPENAKSMDGYCHPVHFHFLPIRCLTSQIVNMKGDWQTFSKCFSEKKKKKTVKQDL